MKSSNRRKSKGKNDSPAPGPSNTTGGFPRAAMVAVVVIGLIGLAFWWSRSNSTRSLPPESPQEQVVATTATSPPSTPPPAAEQKPDFQTLKGKWVRPDGGYVIDIKSVDEGGKIEATYSNPRPINVSKAEASRGGGATRVFIELRDVNYPGSTYTLIYLPERDLLQGTYYQALQQQNFEVFFERMK